MSKSLINLRALAYCHLLSGFEADVAEERPF